MTKEAITLYMDKIRFWVSVANLVWLIGAVARAASWKTEMELSVKADKVATTDFVRLVENVNNLTSRFTSMENKMDKIYDQLIKKN